MVGDSGGFRVYGGPQKENMDAANDTNDGTYFTSALQPITPTLLAILPGLQRGSATFFFYMALKYFS